VFDRTIRQCVRDGAATPAAVTAACGAGSRCGGCRASIEAIVDGSVDRESAADDAAPRPECAAA
jgi:bacterioferritin-associated ferredoxin